MSNEDERLVVAERRGHAFVIGLNRPKSRNALCESMVDSFRAALKVANSEPCVLIIHSTTPGIFASGADIRELRDRTSDDALRAINVGLCDDVEAHRWPSIAIVDGYALGAGCELAMACDFRLASSRALFGQPELSLGIIAGAGGNWRLAQVGGLTAARQMLLLGQTIDAEVAFQWHMIDRLLADGEDSIECAMAMVNEIARRSWRALELTKLALKLHRPATTLFDIAAQALLFDQEEKRDRMSAFLERSHRRPDLAVTDEA